MTKKINLGQLKFDSKKAAKEFFKEILNTGEIGRILNEEETNHLTSLLNLRPRRSEKIGAGIESIEISLSHFNNRCFVINQVDGTQSDFSYYKCIDGDHKPFTIFSNACRQAVRLRRYEWKVSQFHSTYAKCEISNMDIIWKKSRVKHDPSTPFAAIVQDFLNLNNIDLSTIEYDRESAQGVRFEDQQLAIDFDQYHEEHAVLRLVHHKQSLKNVD